MFAYNLSQKVLRTNEIKTFIEWHTCIFLRHERSSYQPILKKKNVYKGFFHETLIHFKGAMLWWVPHFFGQSWEKIRTKYSQSSFIILGTLKRYQWFYRKENKVLHSVTVLGHFSTTHEFNLKKLDKFFKVTIHFHLGLWKSTYSWGIIAEPF